MQRPGIMKDKSSGGQIFSWKQGADRFDGNVAFLWGKRLEVNSKNNDAKFTLCLELFFHP